MIDYLQQLIDSEKKLNTPREATYKTIKRAFVGSVGTSPSVSTDFSNVVRFPVEKRQKNQKLRKWKENRGGREDE